MAAEETAVVPDVKFCKHCECRMTRESVGISAVNWERREFCSRSCWMKRFRKPKAQELEAAMPEESRVCITPGCHLVTHAEDRERGEFHCWRCQQNLGRYLELKRRTEGYSLPREMWGRVSAG